jgi:hypothetical protein
MVGVRDEQYTRGTRADMSFCRAEMVTYMKVSRSWSREPILKDNMTDIEIGSRKGTLTCKRPPYQHATLQARSLPDD